MAAKVTIIILNWNGWKDTIECLESLYQINYPNYNVIILDNASENDSIEKIKKYCAGNLKDELNFKYNLQNKTINVLELTESELEHFHKNEFQEIHPPKGLILIKNDKNYGFTEGNNIGIKIALKDPEIKYFLLLNNDTVVDENLLNEMIKVAKEDDSIGFVGAKTYYLNYKPSTLLKYYLYIKHPFNSNYHYIKGMMSKKVIQSVGGRESLWRSNPKLLGDMQIDKGQFDKNMTVDFIHGACILAKKKLIDDIGLLNADYFSYREENDWCMRGKKRGWKCVIAYKAKIWHKGGGSTSSAKFKPLSEYYFTRNRFLFMETYANRIQITFFIIYFFTFNFCYMFLFLFFRPVPNKSKVIKCFYKASKDGLNIILN